MRQYATRNLGDLIRGSSTANAWTLRLLLTQLYDPEPGVCELAVTYLRDVCESKDVLELVVEMQPMMDHLGEIGHPLLLKWVFLSILCVFVKSLFADLYPLLSVFGIFMMLVILLGKWILGSMFVPT